MDGGNERHNNSRPQVPEQPPAPSAQAHPPYGFYDQGVNRVTWPKAVYAAIQKGNGGHAVAIVAIITLGTIACEFARNKPDTVHLMTLIGCLAIAAMILTIGLLAMFWTRKGHHAENTEENESKTTEPGVSGDGSNENGAAPR